LIKVENVTKKYGGHVAVNNISFEVKDGEIVGFDSSGRIVVVNENNPEKILQDAVHRINACL